MSILNDPPVSGTTVQTVLHQPTAGVERDPEYDWVPPLKDQPSGKRGTQCGECGMKFEFGKAYGYYCTNTRCPTGWGSR